MRLVCVVEGLVGSFRAQFCSCTINIPNQDEMQDSKLTARECLIQQMKCDRDRKIAVEMVYETEKG